MGLFDIFSAQPAQNAAQAQIAGLNSGYADASKALGGGLAGATGQYGKAIGSFAPLTGTAYGGFNMYGDALGVNGQAGMDRARSAFTASPGYQFSLNQGLQAIDRGAAARGMLSSGNTLAAEQNYGTGLANQEYGNWLSGLGSYNSVAPSLAGAQAGLYGNLGNLNYGYGTNLAQLGWNRDTGIGQANAAAAMAPYNASGNFWNLFGNLAGDATKALGYGLPGGGTIGGAMYAASDRRVKDDVEHVGETNDGQPIYRFRYRGEPVGTARLGLIAQNVEKRDPGAVREFGGVKAVDMKRATEGAAKRSTFGVFSRAA